LPRIDERLPIDHDQMPTPLKLYVILMDPGQIAGRFFPLPFSLPLPGEISDVDVEANQVVCDETQVIVE
jgi:hypothetical protein